eukprot:scaffold7578_cov121-Isochrysis_galbana.AAC.8
MGRWARGLGRGTAWASRRAQDGQGGVGGRAAQAPNLKRPFSSALLPLPDPSSHPRAQNPAQYSNHSSELHTLTPRRPSPGPFLRARLAPSPSPIPALCAHLERSEASAELWSEVSRPRSPRSDAPLPAAIGARQVVEQVVGPVVKGVDVRVAIAHQHTAGIVRHVQPLVEVEGQRVGAAQARQAGSSQGRQHRRSAEGAVHVEPELLSPEEWGWGVR